MSLPGPQSGITWLNYRNQTPTYELSSIEKPDLSPFLIHLTGKSSLAQILRGENAPEEFTLKANEGFLRASLPDFGGVFTGFDSKVVCFTESPLFALDFFRYRNFNRWNSDQQYGIGFSKIDLIRNRNVRPVVYLDTAMNRKMINLSKNIINEIYSITDLEGRQINLKGLFNQLLPLLFPMLENRPLQGFMWEREWRCPNSEGMKFPFSGIKVICCPKDEREEIEAILGELVKEIQIVENWREYDDVTNYLKRRKSETDDNALKGIGGIKNLEKLKKLKQQNDRTINMLEAHYGIFKEAVEGLEQVNIVDIIKGMQKKSEELDIQLKLVIEERKAALKLKRQRK